MTRTYGIVLIDNHKYMNCTEFSQFTSDSIEYGHQNSRG